jgi:hypothetical protein
LLSGRVTRTARPRRYVYEEPTTGPALIIVKNIAKAQKEIERLEAEEDEGTNGATDTARKPAQKNQAVNGSADAEAELEQEKDGVADAAKELKEASLEDAAEA